jgi:hypothetical protein
MFLHNFFFSTGPITSLNSIVMIDKSSNSSTNLILVFIQALSDYTLTILPTGTAIRNNHDSKSKSKLLYDWWSVSLSWCWAHSSTCDQIILLLNTLSIMISSQIKLYYDRRSVGQSVLVSGTHLGPVTNFSFFL